LIAALLPPLAGVRPPPTTSITQEGDACPTAAAAAEALDPEQHEPLQASIEAGVAFVLENNGDKQHGGGEVLQRAGCIVKGLSKIVWTLATATLEYACLVALSPVVVVGLVVSEVADRKGYQSEDIPKLFIAFDMIRMELIIQKSEITDDTKKQEINQYLRIVDLTHTWLATKDFKTAVQGWNQTKRVPVVSVPHIRDSLSAMYAKIKEFHNDTMKNPPKPIVLRNYTSDALQLLYPGKEMTDATGTMSFDALLIPVPRVDHSVHILKAHVDPLNRYGKDLASAMDGMKANVPIEENQDRDVYMAALAYIFHRIAPPKSDGEGAYVTFMDAATAAFCKKPDYFVIDAVTIVKHFGSDSTSITIATVKEKLEQYIDHLRAMPTPNPEPVAEDKPSLEGGGGFLGIGGEETYREAMIGLSGNIAAPSVKTTTAHYVFLVFHAICHFGAGSSGDTFYNSMDNIYKSFARKGYRIVVHPDFVHQAKDAAIKKFANGKSLMDHDTFSTDDVSRRAKLWIKNEEPSGDTGFARPPPNTGIKNMGTPPITSPSSAPPAKPAGLETKDMNKEPPPKMDGLNPLGWGETGK